MNFLGKLGQSQQRKNGSVHTASVGLEQFECIFCELFLCFDKIISDRRKKFDFNFYFKS